MDTPHNLPADQPFYPIPDSITATVRPLPVLGEVPAFERYYEPPRQRRRILVPLLLFVATCVSTFWAGSGPPQMAWLRHDVTNQLFPLLGSQADSITIAGRWHDGLIYMLAVMGILLAHEMGHFIQAVRYRVHAELPWFIPMPITPLGTMGAVIFMRGSQADRKELFDIGLTGPLAGLLVALPIAWIGIQQAQAFPMQVAGETIHYQDPLLFKALMLYLRPDLLPGQELTMNPLLMAGWVGMLITGLNMLPISQLDGGHVAYALLGRRSYWLARAVLLAALAFIIFASVYGWLVMLLLVTLIGVEHPPTANDRAPLGWGRRALGLASLAIPILCLAPNPISVIGH
jgi:membrane-associated protease RseP (regulator of RpoE activity)